MLFSTWQFLFVFLPVTAIVYFLLNGRGRIRAGKAWLVAASVVFYGYWNPRYVALITASILLNYAIGTGLAQSAIVDDAEAPNRTSNRKIVLAIGIVANLALLGYYKYTEFFLSNMNAAFGTDYAVESIVLPLAISFFTFTQIAYLVDSARGETAEYDLLNYSLFVLYFPHLIAGPIVHHGDLMPQFRSARTYALDYGNVAKGLTMLALGLFKKVVIADTFAGWASEGFDVHQALSFYAGWKTSLSYTFQLYFDFSGYCDMAVGASLIFNIDLPINFNSPYKALSIQDFWRRWHITLSHFLRDYIYIPLGGNRRGEAHTYLNLFLTFLIGGFWHGATWMFVIWGALHGAALMIHRAWQRTGLKMPRPVAWLVTFFFVNVAWVFFRATTMKDAVRVFRGMFGLPLRSAVPRTGFSTDDLAWAGRLLDPLFRAVPHLVPFAVPIVAIGVAFFLVSRRNSQEIATTPTTSRTALLYATMASVAIYTTLTTTSAVFLYFNF